LTAWVDFAAGENALEKRRNTTLMLKYKQRDESAVEAVTTVLLSAGSTTSPTFVDLYTRRIWVSTGARFLRFDTYATQVGGTSGSLRVMLGTLVGATFAVAAGAEIKIQATVANVITLAGTSQPLVVQAHRGDGTSISVYTFRGFVGEGTLAGCRWTTT